MSNTYVKKEIAGQKLAEAMKIKTIKSGEQKGRYDIVGGTKSAIGLTNTLIRVLEENGFKVTQRGE